MLKKEQNTKLLELAKEGLLTKNNINEVIKQDFLNNYNTCDKLENLYNKLAKRYGKSKRTIQSICAS